MSEIKKKVKVGYVGTGRRGKFMLKNMVAKMEDVEIVIVCDKNPAHLENGKKALEEMNYPTTPIYTTDYDEVVNNPDIDAILLMNGWVDRIGMAIKSMRAGKYTALEVGCAYTMDEVYALLQAYEETKVPVMMLENCCYGRSEMMALNVAKKGLFGELVHCDGAYKHYLTDAELFLDADQENGTVDHYRLAEYEKRNCHQYPTHEMGPICKVLGINRGNRLLTLCSFGSKAIGLKEFATRNFGEDSPFAKRNYCQADVMTTVFTTEQGQTITICLDTTIPRAYYSRDFTVRGTRGMYTEHKKCLYFDDMKEGKVNYDNEESMYEKYDHPLHAEMAAIGKEVGGHPGGMDWLVVRAFIEAVKNGTNTPIDVYDTALLLAIAPLSEMSIAKGNVPVEFPDFTNGKYKDREPVVQSKYCLDAIIEDKDTPIFPEKEA